MIKAIILGDKAATKNAMMAHGGNAITDGPMIQEKPPTTMLNSGHTQSFFRDITGSLRNSYSGGTLHSEKLSSKSKSRVYVGQETIEEGEEGSPQGDEADELDMYPGSRVKFKPHMNNHNNTSRKSMNGVNISGKSFVSNGSSKSGKSVMTTASTVYQEIDDTAARALAAHFADAVLPDEALSFANHYDGEHHLNLFDSFSWRTMMILLENHYMTNFWLGGPSLAKSRCLRFMVSQLHTQLLYRSYTNLRSKSITHRAYKYCLIINFQIIPYTHTNNALPCNKLPGHVPLHYDQCLYLHAVLLGIVSSTNGMQHLSDQGNRQNNILQVVIIS